jgi:hypothetical protein
LQALALLPSSKTSSLNDAPFEPQFALELTYIYQVAMIELAGRHITDKLSSPRFRKKQA